MVVSFKVSKEGKLYRHKPPLNTSFLVEDDAEQNDAVSGASEEKKKKAESDPNSSGPSVETRENKSIAQISGKWIPSKVFSGINSPDNDISFTLSLFPSGYSIRKPVQNEPGSQNSIDVPKFLHPYDRASETLFSSIECGRFPGDIMDDIPCKFIDGAIFCELRDYRECLSECEGVSPIINRVCLRMSLENIVTDMPAIAANDWTYGDLMEVESRILKALQPQLFLDPIPKLDRLSENPAQTKLNLGLRRMRLKRLAQMNEVAVSVDNKIQGKRVCMDRFSGNFRLADPGSLVQQSALVNLNKQNNVSTNVLPMRNNSFGPDSSLLAQPNQEKYHIGVENPRMMRDQWSGALLNQTMSSPCRQDMLNPFNDNAIHGKRDYQDAQSSPLTNKKLRLMHTSGSDGNLPLFGPQTDNLHGSDLHRKNALMQQQHQQPQPVGTGVQYSNNGMQKFSQQVFEGGVNQEGSARPFTIGQEGIRYNLKEEPVEMERLNKPEQRIPQQFMRSGFPQSPWSNLGQPLDNNSRKEDSFQKRKVVQSPRVSAGCFPQSPLSSKSGEFSSGSIGGQFGGVVNSGLVVSQKEKSAVTSVPFMGGNPSFTSSANDNMQRQHQACVPAKRRTTSLPKTSAISGVGSPASVSNMNMPINTSSPPVGAQPSADQTVLDRFSKIEKVAKRFQLNVKNIKVEEHPRKPYTFSAQSIAGFLANDSNNESFNDETCKMMSKSHVGGSINVCKRRVLNFIQMENIVQGNGYQLVPKARARLIMSEKLNEGTVTFHIGDVEDADYLAAEDYLPVLPNTHMADLHAAQFCSLMQRDEYHNTEDLIQPKPVRTNPILTSQHNAPEVSPRSAIYEMQQQFSEGISSDQPSNNDILKPNVPINSTSHNLQRMLPSGNAQGMQISQGNSIHSRTTQQPEPLSTLHQQQQPQQNSLTPHQQLQRPPMMNSMQHLNNLAQNANIHLGAHNMVNKQLSSLQLQFLQQRQQQQPQQLHQQRKIMTAGLGGTVGMGNIGNNNIVGLGNFNNVMGIRSGTGISSPMGTTISSMGNTNQNPSHLSNILRSGTINQAQAAAFINMKTKQNRANMLSGAQSSIGGMTGARQMNPGAVSMLGSGLNRGNNMNQMIQQQQQQRTTMAGAMGPPKLMPGMNNNVYMNQQQQHLQQIQQQQQMQMMQQQQQMQMMQQHLQQQETTSPLQGVLSPPPQMGSPSGSMGIPHHQQASPQQMSQRTPLSPQLSAGGGSIHLSPASPQLSSQTMGSVGNIANSPMELQGGNNSNSGNNS